MYTKNIFPGREAVLVVYNELDQEEAVYLTLDGIFAEAGRTLYLLREKSRDAGVSGEPQSWKICGKKRRSFPMRRSTASAGFCGGQEAGKRVGRKGRNRRRAASRQASLPLKSFWKREVQAEGKEEKTPEVEKKEEAKGAELQPKTIAKEKPEKTEEPAVEKPVKNAGKEKSDRESPKIRTLHFLYTASTFLVLTILVIGVTMINNYDQMEKDGADDGADDGRGHGVWKSGGDRKNGYRRANR